jgi:tetratricopeptide (TPR) repeat protein
VEAEGAPTREPAGAALEESLTYARVLVEMGELAEAEAEIGAILEHSPESYETRSLLARIKHLRGELSEAFACWAQIHSMTPERGGAQMRLSSMLRLAEDPERGTGEFLAVGRQHLWRKPTAILELEQVFAHFVQRRPDEAREAARLLATKYRSADPDLFKLSVLAEAWIAELSGELETAAAVLERLGDEKGFEQDLDRALALVRVYEQLATPEHLTKAVNVCEHLARTLEAHDRVEALGRLARLYAALGREQPAALAEEAFLAAFQESMHRVTLADATAIAATRYLPLPELAAIDFASQRPPDHPGTRQRAILLALERSFDRARELFVESGELLDFRYRADLARMAGNRPRAIELYLEVLGRSDHSRWITGWLLDECADDPRVVAYFRTESGRREGLEVLESALRRAPLRSDLWRQLATLHRLAGDSQEAERCLHRSGVVHTAEQRRESAVGRVLSAAVGRFAASSQGLIHEIWADRRPARHGEGGYLEEILGTVSRDLEKTVRNVFVSVREYVRAKLPHHAHDLFEHTYVYKITKEDEPSHGLSAGLPSALAFLSVFLQRPLAQDVASSGALVADAHDVLVVRRVGDVAEKVRGAYSRSLRTLILPAQNREDLEEGFQVPGAVVRELITFVATLDEVVDLVFGPGVWLE